MSMLVLRCSDGMFAARAAYRTTCASPGTAKGEPEGQMQIRM